MNKIIKVAVVIGRYQVDNLHEGHHSLLQEVANISDTLVILVGSAWASMATKRNPMDYDTRELMLQTAYPNAIITGIKDFADNAKWSENVDRTIDDIITMLGLQYGDVEFEVTLNGGKDCFKKYYSGKFNVVELEECIIEGVDGYKLRDEICKTPINSSDFRKGVIHTVGNRHNIAYGTVDVAVINRKYKVLLGRKPFENLHRFVGGFVSEFDLSLEDAAYRECREEIGEDVVLTDFKYITSMKVDDWRYRGTTDGIMTTLFIAKYQSGEVKASDDIVAVQWFNLYDLTEEDFVAEHRPLFKRFRGFLQKNY